MNNMTEKEMRQRMKEIDDERTRLRDERTEYENYFRDKELKDTLSNRENCIGKCFKKSDMVYDIPEVDYNEHIKAFKVLDLDRTHKNYDYAKCILLVDGYGDGASKEYSINITELGLWTPNTYRMVSRPTDKKVIDFYEEISNEEFKLLYETHKQRIEDYLNE